MEGDRVSYCLPKWQLQWNLPPLVICFEICFQLQKQLCCAIIIFKRVKLEIFWHVEWLIIHFFVPEIPHCKYLFWLTCSFGHSHFYYTVVENWLPKSWLLWRNFSSLNFLLLASVDLKLGKVPLKVAAQEEKGLWQKSFWIKTFLYLGF